MKILYIYTIFFLCIFTFKQNVFANNHEFTEKNTKHVENTYYKSGKIECSTSYKNEKEWIKTCFYESGVKKTESIYFNNTEIQYTWFAPDGLPLMILEYDSNHKLILSKNFYATGELKNITPYKNGKRHGFFKEYDKNGKLTLEIEYLNDILIQKNDLLKTNKN